MLKKMVQKLCNYFQNKNLGGSEVENLNVSELQFEIQKNLYRLKAKALESDAKAADELFIFYKDLKAINQNLLKSTDEIVKDFIEELDNLGPASQVQKYQDIYKKYDSEIIVIESERYGWLKGYIDGRLISEKL